MQCFGRVWHGILCCFGLTEGSKRHRLSSSWDAFVSKSHTLQLASWPLLPEHRSAAERTTFHQQGAEQELLHLPPLAELHWDGGLCRRATLAKTLGWGSGNPCCYLCLRYPGPPATWWALPSLPHPSPYMFNGRSFSRQRVPLIWGCAVVHPREPNLKCAATQMIMNDPNLKWCRKRPAFLVENYSSDLSSVLKPLCVW